MDIYNSDPLDRNIKLKVASSFIETPTIGKVSGEQKEENITPSRNLPKDTTLSKLVNIPKNLPTEVPEQSNPTSAWTETYVDYPNLATEINLYPIERLWDLYFEPVNEQSIKMRTPEDHLKPTESRGKQGYQFLILQKGEIFIHTARVQKEYDSKLKENFYLVAMPPLKLPPPQVQQTPKQEPEQYPQVSAFKVLKKETKSDTIPPQKLKDIRFEARPYPKFPLQRGKHKRKALWVE